MTGTPDDQNWFGQQPQSPPRPRPPHPQQPQSQPTAPPQPGYYAQQGYEQQGYEGYGQGGQYDQYGAQYQQPGGYPQDPYGGGGPQAAAPGYPAQGYGQGGYDSSGYEASGYQPQPSGPDSSGFESSGYGRGGYEQPGYQPGPGYGQGPGYEQPGQGYEQSGYEQSGYESQGVEQRGYEGQFGGRSQGGGQSGGAAYGQQPYDPYYEQQQPAQGLHPQSASAATRTQAPGQVPGQGAGAATGLGQAVGRSVPLAGPGTASAAAGVVPPRARPGAPASAPGGASGAGGADAPGAEPSELVGGRAAVAAAAARAKGKNGDSYTTGEFSFVDEQTEESEDAIDWLKFAESRSEVRAERRRRLRNRLVSLLVVVAVLASGGVGYLWWTGKFGGGDDAATAVGGRYVNVVHLHDPQGKVTTALLVDDEGGRKATVLLLPDTLQLPSNGDSATTTIGKAPSELGASATRDGLSSVLGAKVAGTWRLDTPYLLLLVSQLGGVRVDTNAEVREDNKADGKVLAPAGKDVLLNGHAAVAYATLQAPGEKPEAQLARFGQVMAAVISTMPTTMPEATDDVRRMNMVADPSLPENALAGVLVNLAKQAKAGHLSTSVLTTKADGTLDDATAGKQVKDILGGTIGSAKGTGGSTRVTIVNASGNGTATAAAQVVVINSGMDPLPSSAKAPDQASSEIRYTDDAKQPAALTLATSMGLPDSAVKKVTEAQNADLVLVLGKDYQPPAPKTQ
ncbi:LytR C-terminal domain-containing protein [Kitasatospora cineracea]|uniref:LCP family protein n=1 Tax=Kitasatospora cineracea TaxID=88074 RepID=UPI003419157F